MKKKKIEEFTSNTYKRQEAHGTVSAVKRILNYFIDPIYRKRIIDLIAENLKFKFHPSKYYLTLDNLKEMSCEGMIIGAHSHTHPLMSRLSKNDQITEFKNSVKLIDSINFSDQLTYCHPYGGNHSFNQKTLDLLKKNRISYAFSVDSREITINDLIVSKFSLSRYNCNDFRFGLTS